MRRIETALAMGLAWVALASCAEIAPTSVDEGLLPDEPVTVEVLLSWEEFASALQVFGGYGSAQDLGRGVVATGYRGSLEARTLAEFNDYPPQLSVQDSSGTTVVDSTLTRLSGRVVVRVDTVTSVHEGPVTLWLGATTEEWHASTASWTSSVDTVFDQRPWGEAGGGPYLDLATAVWDPEEADSVVFPLDSAQLRLWADSTSTGALIGAVTEGVRLELSEVNVQVDISPSVNPDTVVVVTAARRRLTFLYSPAPDVPSDGLRIGGAPAWRSVLDMVVPTQLDGPAELCAAVACPVIVTPEQLNYAALVLTSRQSEGAFQPSDSIGLEVRAVLERQALPKSPLGPRLLGLLGARMDPALFGSAAEGGEVEVVVTSFLRSILEEDGADRTAPRTLALLSPSEPTSISYASFFGPGTEHPPRLKLILTVGKPIELP